MQRDRELHVQASPEAGLAELEPASRLGEGIARGALVVAGLTIVSRILGLVRTLVFSQTVGASCLGTAYVTANQVPDLLYQLVLGGALASVMVPVLWPVGTCSSRSPCMGRPPPVVPPSAAGSGSS